MIIKRDNISSFLDPVYTSGILGIDLEILIFQLTYHLKSPRDKVWEEAWFNKSNTL